MYGMVNKAVQDMVCKNYGHEKWEIIKKHAGVDVDLFISNEPYPDEYTYSLVASASEELNIDPNKILIAFGEHWVLETAMEGYGGLMTAGGSNLKEFIINLPNFHNRVQMIFPNLKPPRFLCENIRDDGLTLLYYTDRPGLQSFVIGILYGLGKYFQTPVQVDFVKAKEHCEAPDVFECQW